MLPSYAQASVYRLFVEKTIFILEKIVRHVTLMNFRNVYNWIQRFIIISSEVRFAMRKTILVALLCLFISVPSVRAADDAAAAAAPAVIGTTSPTALSPPAPASDKPAARHQRKDSATPAHGGGNSSSCSGQ